MNSKESTTRRVYQAPEITRLGSVAQLTAAGNASVSEGDLGNMCSQGNPNKQKPAGC